ncbi:MAG TPA: phosphoribosylformylglycinamidine cyclo-ligase [Candidatus Polarisedimenticolia bacterium]|nr:phosphoribosylformylglycinamidine cyclo-ligase [Candidatus Polarisedimenticolia bacterium]
MSGKGPAARPAYARAGVDVEAGERAVELMRSAISSTRRPEVLGDLGGYGGAIAIPPGYREPVIVSSTDGVGTKTAIAQALGRWDTIGIDLVAMCADDVVCTGAEPVAFLDYVAVGRLEPEAVAALVGGVAEGCRQAGCALIGGETAEHPGLMETGTFDLAGTCIGLAERDDLLDGSAARAGDIVIGLASSGLHSNGYSLVRGLLAEWELPLERPFSEQLERTLGEDIRIATLAAEPEHGLATLGEVLLTPTRIYTRAVLAARRVARAAGGDLHGVAHVTGGGLPGNAPRAVGPELGVRLDPSRWRMPAIIEVLGALGGVAGPELRATFNGGLGMLLVVPPDAATVAAVLEAVDAAGTPGAVVGEVDETASLDGVRYAEAPLRFADASGG